MNTFFSRSRPQWPAGFIVLAAAALPALTGWGLGAIRTQVLPGISWSWPAYLALMHLLIYLFLGRRLYANILTVATWITLPVVYVGAAISQLGMLVGLVDTGAAAVGIHYTLLCLTMLTVVPLALALVAVLPFSRLERRLILQPGGITLRQKKLLMVLRVFNHTVFFVMPGLLEVLREERVLIQQYRAGAGGQSRKRLGLHQCTALLQLLTYLAVESICAAVQFIPLWAYEIDRLPKRRPEEK